MPLALSPSHSWTYNERTMGGDDELHPSGGSQDAQADRDAPSSPCRRIFSQYRSSIAALREFFTRLNPVVAGIDTDIVKRREQKAQEVIARFFEQAEERDKKAIHDLIAFMSDSLHEAQEPREIPVESPLAARAILEVVTTMVTMTPSETHHQLLNRSILTGLVGYFEVLVADLAHAFYHLVPDAASNDDKVLSVNELRTFGSIEEAMELVVSKRVDDLLRGTLEDWDQFFKTRMKITLLELVPDWAQWGEMYQRRHAIVHAGAKVTRRYLERVEWEAVAWPAAPPAVGTILPVEDSYLERALDLFETAGLLLCQSVWRKLASDDASARHSADDGLIAAAYQRLLSRNWYVAEHLSRWGAEDATAPEDEQLIHRFNAWLSIKRQGREEEIARDLEHFDSSAKHPKFALALASLRDRADDFFRILPRALGAGLTARELREWPVLEEVRADPRFEDAIAEADRESPAAKNGAAVPE